MIYDKEQEERVDYIDQWTEVEITGEYRRKIEENITKTEAASIRIAVNHERNKVSIFAKGAKSGRNEVTYMLKTDNK